jgi:glycerophosphoryl diester phosphodiesterase
MLILAHRGYSAKYPPNTLLAFEKAIEYGADGVELDVWQTKDGKIVVSHDRNLKKVFGVDVDVKETTYEDLLQYELEGQKIPLLNEVYEVLPESAIVDVEIKDLDAVEGALKIVEKYGAIKRTLFSSFELNALKKLRKMNRNARIAILTAFGGNTSIIGIPFQILNVGAEFLNPPILMNKYLGVKRTRLLLRFYRIFGVKIGFWTVNDPQDIEGLEDLCEVLITDEVEKMLYMKKK